MWMTHPRYHSISIGGVEYRATENGVFDIPDDAADIAASFGMVEVIAIVDDDGTVIENEPSGDESGDGDGNTEPKPNDPPTPPANAPNNAPNNAPKPKGKKR